MTNCSCETGDRQKPYSRQDTKVEIIARGHLLSQTFEVLLAEFKTVQNLTSDFVE